MYRNDSKAWLEKHGRLSTGQSVNAKAKYAHWTSKNDEYTIVRYASSVEESLDIVYNDIKNKLYNRFVELE